MIMLLFTIEDDCITFTNKIVCVTLLPVKNKKQISGIKNKKENGFISCHYPSFANNESKEKNDRDQN